MACDSLYVAWLKVHYPYELYATMLKIFSEKKNKDKVSAIISEMKAYKGIHMTAGKWGQDNRTWQVDKEKSEISQSLLSVRYLSAGAAEDLYQLGQQTDAVMGIEYTRPKLNKEGRKKKKEIGARMKQAEEAFDAGMITDAELLTLVQDAQIEADSLLVSPEYLEQAYSETEQSAPLDCFVNILRAIQLHTSVNARQLRVLIELGYFSQFGKPGKLLRLQREFDDGKYKLEKNTASFMARLEKLREMEATLPDEDLPIQYKLQSELENLGLCLSVKESVPPNTYFISDIDEKYGTTVWIYSISSGRTAVIRFRKNDLARKPVAVSQLLRIIDGKWSPRYTYKDGTRTPLPGEKEYWVKQYEILQTA